MSQRARALLSVHDKRGIVELAKGLEALGYEILSTGGTFGELAAAGVAVTPVSEATGFPEILGGRVKTLHPRIHGGILADRTKSEHATELAEHEIAPIDVVAVNLYPFRDTAADPAASYGQVVEMIDIGGPSMVRAAAKNHQDVWVVVDPDDYSRLLELLANSDLENAEVLRKSLAAKAFAHTRDYDGAVAAWLEGRTTASTQHEPTSSEQGTFPDQLRLDLERAFEPRYGENPHQQAALYRMTGGGGVLGGFEQLQGKELSFNNLLDTDAARRLVALFADPTVVIVKHNNPCGVGRGDDIASAYRRALECDPLSAFGSIVACNRAVDEASAQAMVDLFIEVIVAPAFDSEALEILARKKSLRLLRSSLFTPRRDRFDLRSIDGGMLAQAEDTDADQPAAWTCPTRRQPSPQERSALELVWKVARQVKSNAIVIGNEQQTVGVGAGQMSRVDACRLAVEKAQLPLAGCVAASDAFFPFPDGLEVLAEAGIRAVIQPGGSKRDEDVVAAADAHDVALLMTGRRHFKH